jgi:hypothetical protein
MSKNILFVFLVFCCFSLKAQTWELGGGLGGSGYIGDLTPNNLVKPSGPSISGFFIRNFDGYWSARATYTLGTISAADSNSSNPQFRKRNLSFTTLLSEVSVTGQFNFLNYIPKAGDNKFTPYIYLGFAAVNYYPSTIYNGVKYELRGKLTEEEKKPYPTTAYGVPYGAGIKYNIWDKFTLGAETGYRTPNTGYLDDVSGVYPSRTHNALDKALSDRSGEKTGVYIGTPGTQRGDGKRDTYFFTQITLSYTFVTNKCYFH